MRTVSGLVPGSAYYVTIVAVNGRGRSDVISATYMTEQAGNDHVRQRCTCACTCLHVYMCMQEMYMCMQEMYMCMYMFTCLHVYARDVHVYARDVHGHVMCLHVYMCM